MNDRNDAHLLLRHVIRQMEAYERRQQKQFDDLNEKVDSLLKFKWQAIGAAAASSATVGAVISLVVAVLTN